MPPDAARDEDRSAMMTEPHAADMTDRHGERHLWYHFVGETLRDGRPVPADGVWLEYLGPLKLCQSGLHASPTAWDALPNAPGPILCRVELDGERIDGADKSVASRRRIVARLDATVLLRAFARACARDVLHLWKAPEVVRRYLETGDETLRDAAWDAASAARDAASAAWDAARARQRQLFNRLVDDAFAS
ncbi:MAG: hypothetical protein Q8S13_03495 [Dehalococcoidia bacterium]|nr:hypothetical protein [Dehalococcoidia bacterium]